MGSATYLAIQTRADIAFTCSLLSRFLANPSKEHLNAADHLLRYIKGTENLGTQFGGTDVGTPDLVGYSDSDWAQDPELRKSTSGYVYFLNGGVIAVQSKRQSITALSSTEAEYYALAKAVTEAAWLKETFRGLGYRHPDTECVRIYGDNIGALDLSKNPTFHQRTKHIAVKYHYTRDRRQKGHVNLWYCPTEQMKADGLTKSLTPAKHKRFVEQLGLKPIKLALDDK